MSQVQQSRAGVFCWVSCKVPAFTSSMRQSWLPLDPAEQEGERNELGVINPEFDHFSTSGKHRFHPQV